MQGCLQGAEFYTSRSAMLWVAARHRTCIHCPLCLLALPQLANSSTRTPLHVAEYISHSCTCLHVRYAAGVMEPQQPH